MKLKLFKMKKTEKSEIVRFTNSVEVNLLKPNEAERLKMICRQSLVGKVLETWGGGSELMVSPIEETVESPTATKETFRYTIYAKFEPKNYWFGFRKW